MRPKLIIFDWDGTLADTTGPIIDNLRQAFYESGLAKPPADRIRNLIGYSLVRIIQILAPEAGEHKREEIIETYAAHYLHPANHVRLFPDAIPTLDTLKKQGCLLAVATGKGRSGLDHAIAQTHTENYWDATACASEYPSKPAPDMVLAVCDRLGIEARDSLVVGDTAFDLEMAAHAGARAVGLTTGAHDAQTLRNAPNIGILPRLSDLPDFLNSL